MFNSVNIQNTYDTHPHVHRVAISDTLSPYPYTASVVHIYKSLRIYNRQIIILLLFIYGSVQGRY